jgi:hypothetical protein
MTKDSDCKVYRVFTHSKKAYLTFALLAIILTSCRDTSAIETGMPARVVFPTAEATGAQAYWPTAGWRTSSPEEQGMDPALLGHMFEAIEDKSLDVHSVVVVRNGYIVAEEYYPPYQQDTKHVLYSVTKSVTSALVGIAIEEGAFDGVDQWVVDFFPDRTFENLDSRKEAMTLEHLLTMTAGLDWEEGMSTYMAMYRSEDWVSYALDATMIAEPGEQFVYCSGHRTGNHRHEHAGIRPEPPVRTTRNHRRVLGTRRQRHSHRRVGAGAHSARYGKIWIPILE